MAHDNDDNKVHDDSGDYCDGEANDDYDNGPY